MKVQFLNFRKRVLSIAVAAMTLLIASISGAMAVKHNSMQYGDDYRIFNMEEGANYRQCERQCEREMKCRAWVFIRERVKGRKGFSFNLGNGLSLDFGGRRKRVVPAQCRLKHTVGSSVRNDCCVSGVVRDMNMTDRGEEDRCSRLARVGVKQNDKNLAKGCGFRGRLWNTSYSWHFDRCMKIGSDRMKRGRDARADKLRQCRGGGRTRDRRCQTFADTIVSLAETNIRSECGFSGSRWSTDFDRHYDHCRRSRNRSGNQRQIRKQQEKIRVCLARGGGTFSSTCDDFANRAISQQKKNLKNNCDFSGSRWHKNYRRHYQRCRKLSKWRRARETKERSRALAKCTRRGDRKRDICERFADDALADQRRNVKFGCKFRRKTRWHTNRERHVRICMDLSRRERETEIRVKREALDKCERKNRVDDVKNAFCRDYANSAIDQNRENIKSRCHYTSSLWSDSYRDHYAWCLKSKKSISRRDRRTRRDKLNECRVEGDVDRGYNWNRIR